MNGEPGIRGQGNKTAAGSWQLAADKETRRHGDKDRGGTMGHGTQRENTKRKAHSVKDYFGCGIIQSRWYVSPSMVK